MALYLLAAGFIQPSLASPLQVDTWSPAFDYSVPAQSIGYLPARPAEQAWRLCVVYPHLKDAYWLGVNYGMIEAAKQLGVEIRLFEAGGYPNLERQKKLLSDCAEMEGVDAIILGTVSFSGLSNLIGEISSRVPVLATVNDIADHGVAAKVGVSWYEMGRSAGAYLAKKHPAGSDRTPIAWFPGPKGAGWVPFVDQGFNEGIAGSAVEIVTTGWGDTGKAVQRNLVQEALDSHPEVLYLTGNALMAEAAISVLRKRGLENDIGILSSYFTPGVYRGIARGRILAAPTDAPVLQGELSIHQVVNLLEGRSYVKDMGPAIEMVDAENLQELELHRSLAPPNFVPLFHYLPQ